MKSTLVELFRALLAVTIPLAAFATGLAVPRGRGLVVVDRPGLLARSLLAILVLTPLWALLVLEALPLPGHVRAGIFLAVLAVGIGPVAARTRTTGEAPGARYALELNIDVLVLSILFLPLAVAGVSAVVHREVRLSAGAVAQVVVLRALLPLALGLLLGRLFPRLVPPAARAIGYLVNAVLLLVVIAAVLATGRQLVEVGLGGWLAALVVAAGAILIGHLLGGPNRDDRRVLAAATALRFPALALLLASLTATPQRVVPVVVVYLLAGLLLTGLYGLALRRRGPDRPPPQPGPPVAAPAG